MLVTREDYVCVGIDKPLQCPVILGAEPIVRMMEHGDT
jgi:hypothetical protein